MNITLYRKYRPQNFEEIAGQRHIVKAIRNSLKENNLLWEAFSNLRDARNTFVHEGMAVIGCNPVTVEKANELVLYTEKIIKVVREWLPEKLRWDSPQLELKFEIRKAI